MTERELMKMAETMEEFSMSDFTPEDLRKLDKDYKTKYFEFYDDVKDRTLKKQDW